MLKRPMMGLGGALLAIVLAFSGGVAAVAAQTPDPSSVVVTPPASGNAGDVTTVHGVYAFTPGGGVQVRVDDLPTVLATLVADGNGSTANYSTSALSPGVHQFGLTDVLSGMTLYSNNFTLNAPPLISGSMPNGIVAVPFSRALTMSGYPVPVASIKSGSLPAGLSLSAAGVVSGAPAVGSAGSYTAVIAATSTRGEALDTVTFWVLDPAVTVVTGAMRPAGDVVTANGSGFTPGGSVDVSDATDSTLLLHATADSLGKIAFNTSTLPAGTHQFLFKDLSSGAAATSTAFMVTVAPTIGGSLSNAVVGVAYSVALTLAGVPSPNASIVSGSLPPGLSLSAAGVVSGTPAAGSAGQYTAVVEATSVAGTVTQAVTFWVLDPAVTVVTGTMTQAGAVVTAKGSGFTPAGDVEVWDSTVPSLLATVQADAMGKITYSTSSLLAGTHQFLFKDLQSKTSATSFTLTVVIAPTIGGGLPNAVSGVPYSVSLPMTGSPTPVASIVSGLLPAGLSLSAAGVVSGTPAAGTLGKYTVDIGASSVAGSMTLSWTFWVIDPSVSIVTSAITPAGEQVTASGSGFTPYGDVEVWDSTVPTLLATMQADASGTITYGIDTLATGTHQFLTKDLTTGTSAQSSTLTVVVVPTVSGSLPNALVNSGYSAALNLFGDPTPVASIVSGVLPAGLSLSAAGVVSGTPAAGTAGRYDLLIRATNLGGTGSVSVRLWVLDPAVTLGSGVLTAGNQVTAMGEGFTPGGDVEVWIHSTPVLLGKVQADSAGRVSFSSTMVPLGMHHFVLKDLATAAEATSAAFTIAAAPVVVPPVIAPLAASSHVGVSLPFTGADVGGTALVGFLLLLFGVLIRATRRQGNRVGTSK
jgi:hypothetical protein